MKKTVLLIAVTTALISAGDLVYKNKKSVLARLANDYNIYMSTWESTWEEIDDVYKKDKEVVLKTIGKGLCIIDNLDNSLQKDKDVVLASLTKAHCGLKYADENLSSNKELIVELLKYNYKEFNLTKLKFQKDEEVLLAWLKDNYYCDDCNKTIGQKLLANRVFALKAIEINENIFPFISNDFLKDREFVLEAVKANLDSFSKLPKEFQNDKKFVLEVMALDPYIYYLLSDALQKDKGIQKFAPKDEYTKKLSSNEEELKKEKQRKELLATDKEYVLAQLKKFERIDLFAINPKFLKDRELLLLYLNNAWHRVGYRWSNVKNNIDNKFLEDKSFLIDLVKAIPDSFQFVYEKVKDDRDATLTIVKKAPWYLYDIDAKYKKDEVFIEEVISLTGYGMQYATAKQQDNRTLALKAIEEDSNNFAYLSKRLKGDKELVLKVVNNYNFKFFDQLDNNLSRDHDVVMTFLKQSSDRIDEVDSSVFEDKAFAQKVFEETRKGFKYLTKEQQQNKKLILEVVENYYRFDFFNQLDNNLSRDEDVLSAYINMRGDIGKIDEEVLEDKALVKNLFMKTGKLFEYLLKEDKRDKSIILKGLEHSSDCFKNLDANLSRDYEVVIAFLKTSNDVEQVDKKLFENKVFAQRVFEETGKGFEYLTKEQQQNKKLVLEVVVNHYNFDFFNQLDKKLFENKAFAQKVFEETGDGFKYLTKEQQKNKKLILEVVANLYNFDFFNQLDNNLSRDEDILIAYINIGEDIEKIDKEILEDKALVKNIFMRTGKLFEYLSKEQQQNKELILKAIESKNTNLNFFKQLDNNLSRDTDVVIAFLKASCSVDLIDSKIFENKALAQRIFEESGEGFDYLTKEQQKNKETLFKAIESNAHAFNYAEDSLKKDKSFILKAIQLNGSVIYYVDNKFKHDQELLWASALQNGFGWVYADDKLKKNPEYLLAMLKHSDDMWDDINETLKKDKSFMLKAIKSHASEFRFADKSLKKDKDFVLEAIEVNWGVVEYLSDKFKKDKEFILGVLKENPYAIEYIDNSLKKDKDVLSVALKKGYGLKYATNEQKIDKDFVLNIIKLNPYAFQYADESLKKDKEFVLEAMDCEKNAIIFRYVDESIQNDLEVINEALYLNSSNLKYVDESLKKDRLFILSFLEMTEFAEGSLGELDKSLRKDKKIVEMALDKGSEWDFDYADDTLKRDKAFILKLMKKHDIFLYIDSSLREDIDFLLEVLERYPEKYNTINYKLLNNERLNKRIDEIKHPIWKKIFNPLTILLFGLFGYWFLGRKKV